jgi:hypothetical protein
VSKVPGVFRMKQTNLKRTRGIKEFEKRLASAKRLRAVEDARFRVRQVRGKLRRFMQANFRKDEVEEMLELRRGDCNRCGACCEILFKCPFLKKHFDGSTSCGIYEDRPNQCRLFPLQRRDLDEVRGKCSYSFDEPLRIQISRIGDS